MVKESLIFTRLQLLFKDQDLEQFGEEFQELMEVKVLLLLDLVQTFQLEQWDLL